jgi:predicted permease
MLSDLRHAIRSLAKSPGFTAVAVLTLALGIGACTAIFSIVRGVLLRPLAFHDPERLVLVREVVPDFGFGSAPVCARHFLAWRERAASFEGLSLLEPNSANLTQVDVPTQLNMMLVSPNLFEMLGVPPVLGRTFASNEDTAGGNLVVVLSDGFWRRQYGADPSIIGRSLMLDGESHIVIGVLPRWFRFPEMLARKTSSLGSVQPDVFKPKIFSTYDLRELMGRYNYGVIARLKHNVATETATAELNAIDRDLMREAGSKSTLLASLTPLHEAVVRQSRQGLWVLFGAVTSVLLIACVNLANLMLARAERRKAEAALRLALGASRMRLIRLVMTEALVVALLGGGLGILLANLGFDALLRSAPASLPRSSEVTLDGGVLVFALTLTAAVGLLFGLVPAWQWAQGDPQQALQAGSRTLAGARGSMRLSRLLIAAEVSLGVLLLATSALLGGSFLRLIEADKGFDAPTAIAADVAIPSSKYGRGEQRLRFFDDLVARVEAMPGVRTAAVVNALPLQGKVWGDRVRAAGAEPSATQFNVNVRLITGRYFETLGIPLLAGRTFNGRDGPESVTVISRHLAEALWPGQNPVGRRLERNPGDEAEVIGVVGDVRTNANEAPPLVMYRPSSYWPLQRMLLVVRSNGSPQSAAGTVRAALRATDPDVPIPTLRTMDDILDASIAQQRFQTLLAAAFAITALFLTVIGIYGVVAYSVTRRRKELGIRMAFGATPAALQRLVIGEGMKPVVLGLLVGLAGALALGRVLASLLYETNPHDPLTLASVVAFFALVGAAACYLPTRRTAEVDPIEVLRTE